MLDHFINMVVFGSHAEKYSHKLPVLISKGTQTKINIPWVMQIRWSQSHLRRAVLIQPYLDSQWCHPP